MTLEYLKVGMKQQGMGNDRGQGKHLVGLSLFVRVRVCGGEKVNSEG